MAQETSVGSPVATAANVCWRRRAIASLHGKLQVVSVACTFALTTGCVTPRTYHENQPGDTWHTARSVVTREELPPEERNTPYDLAFVEFGEEGTYRDRSQVEHARDLIEARPKPLVVVYVHGWHHNAQSDDNDVVRFRKALLLLSKANLKRPIVGVYLGWRGESLSFPPGVNSVLTYYDRKAAAERLANNFDCFEAIGGVLREAHHNGGRTIIIGHSFGGLVVERAIKGALTSASSAGGGADLLDSLIIMMNPATESVLSRQTADAFATTLSYREVDGMYVGDRDPDFKIRGDQPLAISVTANNDRATGMLFPISSWLWQLFHPLRGWQKVHVPGDETPVREGHFFRHTPGNSTHLHNITAEERKTTIKPKAANAFYANLDAQKEHDPRAPFFYTSARGQSQKAGASLETAADGEWKAWDLKYVKKKRVPYWHVQVPKEIINNHGGIWSNNSVALIAALYRMRFPVEPRTAPSRKQRPPDPQEPSERRNPTELRATGAALQERSQY
jgi:pimeloyl-ACP methyl ester carboxylesterase